MELNVTLSTKDIDFIEIQKMSFIYNAINTGWAVKKKEDKFFFTKKHENKREVYLDTYLQKFIESNLTQKNSSD